MKHHYIQHLPHPHSRKWGYVTLACYAGSGLVMLGLIAALYLLKK